MPGFGDAMESVGWVVENDQGLIFPRFFDEYNVEPDGKNKSKNAERQARYREKKRLGIELKSNVTSNVTRNVTVTPREEKRREEINTPLPPKGEEDPSKGKPKTKRRPSETTGEFQPPKRFDTPEVRQALADFESMRLRTGKRIKDRGNVCRGWDTRFVDAKHLLACIDVAISNEYQGISPDYVDPSKVLEAKKPSLWETAKKY
jgi:hypothetical protein